jgi:uncharacterized membrane protein
MKKHLLLFIVIIMALVTGCTFPDIPGLPQLPHTANNSWFYGPFSIVMWIFMAAIYFMPTIIAIARRRSNLVLVLMINAFLGWTLVGWVIALILALI